MPDVGHAADGHRGTRAVQRMVEHAPGTGSLALWVRHEDRPEAPGAGPGYVIATDGHTVFYGAGFAALPLAQQAGLLAHEVLHIALRHVPRLGELQRLVGDVDLRLYNLCADAIVNSALGHLRWLALPPGAITLERLLQETLGLRVGAEAALLAWDVERLYRAIDDRRGDRQAGTAGGGADPRGQRGEGEARPTRRDGPRAAKARALCERAELDLLPGAVGDEGAAPEVEAEAAETWRERLLRGHAGDGEHSLLRALLADVPRSRTPWEQVLRRCVARGLAAAPSLSWSRPSRSYLANQGRAGDRRMPWEPGRSCMQPAPRLALVVDVSGSIDAALLARFGREVAALTRRHGAALALIIGDDQVRRVEVHDPGRLRRPNLPELESVRFRGGGGTDFTPLLEEADRHRPDLGIVLTDLEGPARFRPRWPVLWAVPEASAAVAAPFGRTLVLTLA